MSEDEKKNKKLKEEKELTVNVLVDELVKAYPHVNRGNIYEAAMCITDENFLTNYLAKLEKEATYVAPAGGIGDIFSKTNPRELDGIIDMGEKLNLSKNSTILLSGLVGLARVVYTSLTDKVILDRLDVLELNHNKAMVKKASAMLENNKDAVPSEQDKNK